jgi:hypothetical protein
MAKTTEGAVTDSNAARPEHHRARDRPPGPLRGPVPRKAGDGVSERVGDVSIS